MLFGKPEFFFIAMSMIALASVTASSQSSHGHWALNSVRQLDFPAGRYTQIRTSPADGLPTIVWNGAGLRFSRCLDTMCTNWTSPVTLPGTDPDPRFIRMEFAHDGLPVMVYGAANDTELHLTKCEDQACSKLQTLVVARAQKVRHPGLALYYYGSSYLFIAAELSNSTQLPIGCSLSVLEVALDPLAVVRTTVFDHSKTPYVHTGVLPTGGFEMPALIPSGGNRVHLAYWKVETRELVMIYDVQLGKTPALKQVVIDVGHNASSSPGAWVRGIADFVAQGQGVDLVLLSYWDLGTGQLKLARCDQGTGACEQPEVVDRGGQLDLTDYGAGAFPDFRTPPLTAHHGGPVLVYFSDVNTSGVPSGQLRLLMCPALGECTSRGVPPRRLSTAASGKAGFGRDAALTFTHDAMIITFLDLQGKDSPTEMVARIASFRWAADEWSKRCIEEGCIVICFD